MQNAIKPIKKWRFKSSSVDICKLLQLAVNFKHFLETKERVATLEPKP